MNAAANIQNPPDQKTWLIRVVSDPAAELELKPGRFTIGAGPQCDLRLAEPEGRALQSLVVCGPRGVMIRNMRPDAQLNGGFFREAMLQPGDQLKYGDTEFELVQRIAPPSEPAPEPPEAAEPVAAAHIDHDQPADDELANLHAELEAARNELAHLKQEAEHPPAPQVNTDALQAEIAAAREQLQQERAEAEALLRAERDRLEQQAAELQAERAALASEPPTVVEASTDREQKIAEREQQLADAVAREQAALDAQREELEQERIRLQEERELARAEIEHERLQAAQHNVVSEEPLAAEEPVADVFAPEAAAPEPEVDPEPEPAAEKEDTAKAAEEALARMKAAGIFRDLGDDEPSDEVEEPFTPTPEYEPASIEEPAEAPVQEPVEEEPAKPSLGDAAPVSFIDQYGGAFDEEDDEDYQPVEPLSAPAHEPESEPVHQFEEEDDHESSIEDYMAQLMQRMQGGPAALSAPAAAPKAVPRSQPAQKAKPEVVAKPVEEAPQPVLDPSEYKPRSNAPEQTSNLAAMRDLANQTARSAIKTSTKKVRWAYAGARFGMALFFFAIGAVMLYMTSSIISPMFLGSLVTFVGGGVLCYQGAQVIAGHDPHAGRKPKAKSVDPRDDFNEEDE